MARIRITQTGSRIKEPKKVKQTIEALGLKRTYQTVEHEDTPQIRGMLKRVEHLVDVEEVGQ